LHRFTGHEGAVASVAFAPTGHLLAASSADAPVYIWDITGSAKGGPAPAPLGDAERARLWQDLADADAAIAFRAMRRLTAVADEASVLLGERLKPAAEVDAERVRRLLRDLDADRFATRERATEELSQVAEQAEGMLRQAMQRASPEATRRLNLILRKVGGVTRERLRETRAVEVLEWIGNPAAKRLLARLAQGAAGMRLTTEAAAACERSRLRTR
jgi:hypothetical protein